MRWHADFPFSQQSAYFLGWSYLAKKCELLWELICHPHILSHHCCWTVDVECRCKREEILWQHVELVSKSQPLQRFPSFVCGWANSILENCSRDTVSSITWRRKTDLPVCQNNTNRCLYLICFWRRAIMLQWSTGGNKRPKTPPYFYGCISEWRVHFWGSFFSILLDVHGLLCALTTTCNDWACAGLPFFFLQRLHLFHLTTQCFSKCAA